MRGATHRLHTLIVEGVLPFPIDMLRYDSCWPATEADSAAILNTIESRNPGRVVIHLLRAYPVQGRIYPTAARWASFGWRVWSQDAAMRLLARDMQFDRTDHPPMEI